jgi:hypothetical protein
VDPQTRRLPVLAAGVALVIGLLSGSAVALLVLIGVAVAAAAWRSW